MILPAPRKPTRRFFCSTCGADTPHYLRADGRAAICLAHSRSEDRPVKELVQAMPVTKGWPEKRV